MDTAKFKLHSRDKTDFEKAYDCLFNKKWYPNDFIKPEFDLLYYLYPSIYMEGRKEINTENDFIILDGTYLTKKGDSTYLNWNYFLYHIVEYYKDTKIYFKAKDFRADDGEENYCLYKKDIIEMLKNGEVKSFFDEISSFAMDDGFVLFGNSAEWGYYSGDLFYFKEILSNKKHIEFDIFFFKESDKASFWKIIEKSRQERIIINEEQDIVSFFLDMGAPNRKIYQMKY